MRSLYFTAIQVETQAAYLPYLKTWMLQGLNRSHRSHLVRDGAGLFHFLPGFVAVTEDEFVLERLVLFVLKLERVAFGVDQLNLQFAEGAVLLGVQGMVNQLIL